jgi:tryptophan synthase alpha chain
MITQAILNREKAVLPYVTAGVPDLDTTGEIIRALEDAGAAAIELGLPFSDPMADGPVLQKASHLALTSDFTMEGFVSRLAGWSDSVKIPLIVMSYINPIMRKGFRNTVEIFRDHGAKGMIIPDLPRDAAEEFNTCRQAGMDLIRLVAPTTSRERHREILSQCSGFVYAVSIRGVTGQRDSLPVELKSQVSLIRGHTDLPVCVGFGISTAKQVEELHTFADGVIVGSFIMEKVMAGHDAAKAAHDALRSLTGT